METKQFKAESKRLLDMMINSIYTHKEIFLREIISNASDAIDKLYFKSLTDTSVGLNKDDFAIQIKADKEAKTLTVEDNGIGMTEEELENNLGTIAQSGSLAFKTDNDLGEDVDIIGQFGVGFYSTFMVAKEVRVLTKAYGSDKAFLWKSNGVDGYTIEPAEKETAGTVITMVLKEDTEDEKYSEYCETWRIQQLVKKYSDYIRFPIKMDVEHSNYAEEGEEPTTTIETETLNSMTPIWKKNKSELTDEDYNKFYSEKFMDYQEPIAHIHSKNEGIATYDALLYIPSKAPFDYYSKDYEKGLQLFSSGVLIMDKCADLLPDWFSFVKGVVDSEDLSLNISREMLQQDRQVKIIAKNVEKSIKNELAKLLKNDREKYEKFFEVFGLQFKFGIYQSYGAAIDTLKDLLLFKSTFEDGKSVTLKEYVSRMKEDQKYIYYACGETKERIDKLPQIEKIKDMGYEVLYMTQDVDDFCLKVMLNYDGKTFKSISDADVDLDTEEEKEEVKKLDEENKDMFAFMQETIADKVNKVRLSKKLKSHPVCLSSDGGMISIEMEKVLNAMPQNDANRVKADKALEINPNHEIFSRLQKLYAEDKDTLKDYTKLLYDQALLIEGLSIDDPVEFANLVCKLMVQ